MLGSGSHVFAALEKCSPTTVIGSVVAVVAAGVCAAAVFARQRVEKWEFQSTTALITGGSTGIGLETAKALVRQKTRHVVIAARREEVLKKAVQELETVRRESSSPTAVHYVVMDVCSEESVRGAVAQAQKHCGGCPVSLLICSAGFATPMRFLDCTIKEAEKMTQTNYYGCLRVMWAVMPSMIKSGRGRIVVTSSLAALAPIAGYSLYAGTKAGLRALAHCVDMENSCFGVRVQVASPPDCETPGFDAENEIKSPECRAISELGGAKPFTAKAMADTIVAGIADYRFDITLGLDGIVLQHACAGMEPPTSVSALLLETTCAGALRLILAVYSKLHYNIVRNVRLNEEKKKK